MIKYKNSFVFISIVLLVAINNNCFEYLSNHNIKASQTLFYRGVFSFVFCVLIALVRSEPPFPRNLKEQSIRFVTTGGSLLLILMSYSFLSAGTVSLLQRLDIPFLIFVSLIFKKKKSVLQIFLSIFTVLAVLTLTINTKIIEEDINGFFLVFGSILMTAIGYFTVHKGSHFETVPALINVSAISSIIFGLFTMFVFSKEFIFCSVDFLIIALSALINILLFYLTIGRYKLYTPERALLPFVCAIISTSIFEMIIERKIYNKADIVITFILTLIICLICINGKRVFMKTQQQVEKK